MRVLHAIRRRWALFALIALYAYLTVHTLSGSQGIASLVEYDAASERLAAELEELRLARAALERKSDALSSDALQLDALDMRARSQLWASREDELILPIPNR